MSTGRQIADQLAALARQPAQFCGAPLRRRGFTALAARGGISKTATRLAAAAKASGSGPLAMPS